MRRCRARRLRAAAATATVFLAGVPADAQVIGAPLLPPLRTDAGPLDASALRALAVFDHSLADAEGRLAPGACDGEIVAFDGTRARRVDGADREGCDRPGYRLAFGAPVVLRGVTYLGRTEGEPRHLAFDGHAGWDFAAEPHVPVVAAVAGRVTNIRVPGPELGETRALAIVPFDVPDLVVVYGGLAPERATVEDGLPGCPAKVDTPVGEGAVVEAGCVVGRVGRGGQLHFEVHLVLSGDGPSPARAVSCPHDGAKRCVPLDPFGWTGSATQCGFLRSGDTYECTTGIAQRRLWADPAQLDPESRLALRLRALDGDEDAMRRLVGLLDTAEAPARPLALAYVEALAARGDVAMQLRAAQAYLEGRGVPADPAAARAWLEKATAAGNTKAMVRLAKLLLGGSAEPADLQRARELVRAAEAAGDPEAAPAIETLLPWRGRWTGWGDQSGQRWSIEVDFESDPVRVSYPSLRCSGHWTLVVELADGKRVYREQITDGRSRCVVEGLMTLSHLSDDILEFRYRHRLDGPVTSHGTLERVSGR